MNSLVRGRAAVALLMFSAACRPTPNSPSTANAPPGVPSPIPPPTPNFPPLSGSSHSYAFARELSYPVSDYTKQSRFVLYDDGAFVLQYVNPAGSLRGADTNANGVLTFEWEGSSVAAPWGATGMLNSDSLTVRYNAVMLGSDFEDAVYVLMQ